MNMKSFTYPFELNNGADEERKIGPLTLYVDSICEHGRKPFVRGLASIPSRVYFQISVSTTE